MPDMTAEERAKKMDEECHTLFGETRVSEFYTLRETWRELYARHIREAEEAALRQACREVHRLIHCGGGPITGHSVEDLYAYVVCGSCFAERSRDEPA